MKVWRLAKAACTTPNGEGAKKYGGRWNPSGPAVVYTSESVALAAFEALVHAESDLLPDDFVIMSANIPDTLPIRTITPQELPDNWRAIPAPRTLQAIGSEWAQSHHDVGLRVPSAVIPQEWNILLNLSHPEFSTIEWTNEGPFQWDPRMRREHT